ncbi:MAG TPA: hypothetical protein VK836_18130 [Streptosporangiaceae bacterium]|nr:hypothetical protein [Streptosporangiaceae bacterium]
MSTSRLITAATAMLATAVLAVGCGSTSPHSRGSAAPVSMTAASLNTSVATAGGTWATVVMGGAASQYNNFWQLFSRPAGSSTWMLATPPGTADNGGLVVAGGSQFLVTAFRPSQDLTYTPLIQTGDGGQAWSALSPLDAPLASTPDALATPSASGTMMALLTDGTAEQTAGGSASWKTLATPQTIAATTAGRSCGLSAFTAAGYTPSGVPLLAGACSKPGTAGIFASIGGTWQQAGPQIPAAFADQDVAVLRLTRVGGQLVTLLAAGSGHDVSLLAGWSADNGGHWTLSPALPLRAATMDSASFGNAGAVAVMAGGRADVVSGSGTQWQALPALPPGTATLAPVASGEPEALAVAAATLTVWQLVPGASDWTKAQVIHVPIQYGSSG